jgi:ABC transport system ATP-binding/permease protein
LNYLSAEAISKSFGDKWLFKNITFGISQGQKIAMVGANGAGKSTLLRVLTGEIAPDEGEVSIRKEIIPGFLTQQPSVPDEVTVKEVLFDSSNEKAAAVKAYEECLIDPETSADTMQAALEKMEVLKAWDYESKVKEIIGRLGVPDLNRTFGKLSGGQRKRIFLAQVLLREPDLLIMDEPTNHLDIEAIEWLEGYLSAQQITLIMVTHDRYFLDNVANQIVELDRGNLYIYNGNYAYFLEKKSEREEIKKAEVTKARNLLKKELEWMRRQPKARGTKAKYRIEAFHELKEKASQNLKKDKLELDIQETRQGGKILELHHLKKSFPDLTLIRDFSYVFKKGDRIGVVGKNGVGKSTFLGLLTGKIAQDSGKIIPGQTTKIGYFTQEAENLNENNRVIDEVKEIAEFITLSDGAQISASKFLEMFLFPPTMQYNPIHKLSGGEKKRLQLLKVLVANPNFLILDEPTNDLDIDTLNVLEEFLVKFSGCLLLVSHDRYFMDHLVDHLFVFEGEGNIRDYNGNYSDYREEQEELALAKEAREAREAKEAKEAKLPHSPAQPSLAMTAPSQESPKSTEGKPKLNFKEKTELEKLDKEIPKLEKRKEELALAMQQAGDDHEKLLALAAESQQLVEQLEEKTMRWLELSERA